MAKINNKAFTLVELLAVIVILAVILVIAVPSIMSTIIESRKGALESSAKLIASSAETAYMSNQTLGIEKDIECKDISNYTDEDYKSCDITFVDGKAQVTLVGQGKFDGMAVCVGTKEEAEVEEPINGKCPTPFEKDTWATIKAAVDSEKDGEVGATSKYKVGDTKTVDLGSLGTHTLRIANKTACDGTLESQTACGFVIEFADIITTHNMNGNDTNAGGWPASAMRTYVNGDIYNALPVELRNEIKPTKVVSSLGYEDKNRAEGNFVSTDKLYLLSSEEVYGTSFLNSYDTSIGTSRQLDYYATYVNTDGTKGVTTSNYSGATKQNAGLNAFWWLRSATANAFCNVNDIGNWYGPASTNTYGVSPAFRLG